MKRSIIPSALIAAALLFSSSMSYALDNKSAAAEETDVYPALAKARAKSTEASKASAKQKAKERAAGAKAAATAKVKPVDINSAGKEELKKLPGIGDAEADKIIAGRPYLSKANLVTHKVLPEGGYEPIKRLIIARQKQTVKAKPGGK